VIILDSFAMMAYLEQEKGADRVEQLMRDARDSGGKLLMSVVNWGEIFYIITRERGERKAQEVLLLIEQLPIDIVAADRQVTLKAASLKAGYPLAYADCFAAGLAMVRNGTVLTGDPEFLKISSLVAVEWL